MKDGEKKEIEKWKRENEMKGDKERRERIKESIRVWIRMKKKQMNKMKEKRKKDTKEVWKNCYRIIRCWIAKILEKKESENIKQSEKERNIKRENKKWRKWS